MTSFVATSLSLLGHLPETVTAVLATTRPLTNCSIVPVILSNDDIWDALCAKPCATTKQRVYLKLFSTFSDTMQFTEKLRFEECLEAPFANQILQNLINTKRYFKSGVKHIDFADCDSVTIAAAGSLTNIRTVDLNRCTGLTDAGFDLICNSFPLLEVLEMKFYDEMYGEDRFNITGEHGINNGLAKLTNLTELDLEMLDDEMSTMLKFSTLKKLKKLRKLSINKCEEFTSETFDIDEEEDEQEGEPALFALRELKIECEEELTDATIDFLQRHAPNLTSLYCPQIESAGIQAIAKLTSLSTLSLEGVHPDNIKFIGTNLTNLEHLRICCTSGGRQADSSDTAFEHISRMPAPALRVLEVSECQKLTGKGLLALTALASLEKLSLETVHPNNNIEENFSNDDDGTRCCFPKSLKHLHLSGFPRLNDEILAMIMKPLLSLRHLELSRCSKRLTCEGLKQALDNNGNTKSTLEVLILSECTGLKNLCFLEGLTNLKELDLSKTKLIYPAMRRQTDNAGFNLLPASTLESLNLSETDVEDEDVAQFPVDALVKYYNLKRLDLSKCGKLSHKALDEVVSKLTSLQFLNLKGLNVSSGETKCFVSVFEKLPKLLEFQVSQEVLASIMKAPELQRRAKQVNVVIE